MVTCLTSPLASGQITLMCGQKAPSSENFWPVSSQSFNSDTAVMVLETLATPIGLSTVHFTLGCSFSQGARAQPSAPFATTLPPCKTSKA